MPKGNTTAQTRVSEKYQKKAGYMTKGFKLKREIVEEFEETCKRMGVNQAPLITEWMKTFIKQNK